MREAPSKVLMESVWEAGGSVRAYDPEANNEAARTYGSRDDLFLAATREEAVEGADALVIRTEWNAFRTIELPWLKSKLRTPIIVDGRNLFDPETVRDAGIAYFAVGRGDSLRRGESG